MYFVDGSNEPARQLDSLVNVHREPQLRQTEANPARFPVPVLEPDPRRNSAPY